MTKCLSQLKLPYEMLKSAFEDNMENRQAIHNCLCKAEITRAGVTKSGPTFKDD